jgi:translation initiation factor IF-2
VSKRIHELAKELDKTNKEIITFLTEKNVEVKSHMSVLTDEQESMIKKAFAPKTAAPEGEASGTQHKKKKIIAVYNAHNSQTGIKDPRADRRQGQQRPQNQQQNRPAQQKARPVQKEGEKTQPAQPKPVRLPRFMIEEQQKREQEKREQERREQEKREKEQQNRDSQSRDNRQKTYNNNGQSRDGQRTYNNNGQSRDGQRTYNNNGQSRDGQRAYNGNNQSRSNGQGRDGQRPYNNNGQSRDGQRPYNNNNQNRDGRRNEGRDSRRSMEIPAAPAMELRKTENRRAENKNRNDDTKKDKNSKFNDNWGGKPGQGGRRPNQGSNRPNQKNGKAGKGAAPVHQPAPAPKKEDLTPKVIEIPEMISIHDLAEKMKIQPSVIIKKLFLEGKMVTVNSELDFDAAGELAMEMNFDPVPEVKEDVIEKMLEDVEDAEETLVTRPPVVCVMGHVDHGKTSLLDAIRDTHVIDREAGGITQHIGAYVVTINGEKITFLDTPGHEAFTAMRMRGANSTDIAILVVAADDGVMPQTVEAINHAKAAGIEIIVAINKIDKPSANIERVKQELVEYELIPEDWGGSTVFVPVSAHTHEGIDQLLEMILLTAEVMELKANPNRRARGLVIEAELDKGKGPVARVLVQKGTLHIGDPIAVGACHGKVRAMMDDNGHRVKEAGPSRPVEILGLNDVPNAGEIFVSPETDKEARAFAETYVKESREKLIEDTKLKMSLDDLYSQIQSGSLKELNIIVKADVQGSVEAVKQSLLKLSNEEVVVKIIHGGVGAINESDVSLASASNAIIIGFNVRPDATAKDTAEREKVDLRLYRVIYDAINDVEAAMKGMLDPVYEEKVLGHAEVRQIFKASGVGNIAGSYVLDGVFQRGCKCRITREGAQIFDGPLASLKRFKDDVKEVKAGYECGLVFEKFNDIQELDIVEAYTMVEVPR